MRYVTLTGPLLDLCGLFELANNAAYHAVEMTEAQVRGLKRLECAIDGRPMPGHPPGHHRGPDLDVTRKQIAHS